VSKHLAVLERAGLVGTQRAGREVRYAVEPDRVDVAAQAMARVAAQWDARVHTIQRLTEAADREQAWAP
jgi:DNA-binding transcriptional ArsR family regulator